MITIHPVIHFGFIGSIWKKRWRSRKYSNTAKSLACDKSGRSLSIAFHEKSRVTQPHFYIHNGLTVRDVMNECKSIPFKSWGVKTHNLIGDLSAPKSLSVCLSCKGSFLNECTVGETTLCSFCMSSEKSARSMTYI